MTANGANAQRTIEAHGRPGRSWPQAVIFGSERINECAYLGGISRKLSLMDIEYLHDATLRRPPSEFTGLRGFSRRSGGMIGWT